MQIATVSYRVRRNYKLWVMTSPHGRTTGCAGWACSDRGNFGGVEIVEHGEPVGGFVDADHAGFDEVWAGSILGNFMESHAKVGDFQVRLLANLGREWLEGLVGEVGRRQVAGGSTYFVMELPAAGGRDGGRGFVKVATRRAKHTVARRMKASRAVDEVEACVKAAKVGLAVHEPLCVGEHRVGGLWERSFVVTRFVDEAEDVASRFGRTREVSVLLDVAGWLRRLHDAGMTHGDARLANFVEVGGAGGAGGAGRAGGAGGVGGVGGGIIGIDLCQMGQCGPAEDCAVLLGCALAAGATAEQVAEVAKVLGLPVTSEQMHIEAERESQRRYGYKVIGAKGAHDALRRELAAAKPCKVLDAPAGEGVLSEFLRIRGWDVHCADIDPGHFKLPHLPLTTIDLNRAIPFADATFDAVITANSLHRLYNPAGAVRELARVLRPGGRMYINVNNYANVEKRLRFLVYGSLDNQVNSSIAQQSTDAPEANLRVALHMPMMVSAIERAGLRIEKVRPSAMGLVHWLLLPVALVFFGLGFLVGPRSRARNALRYANGWGVLPGGKYLLIVAQKP